LVLISFITIAIIILVASLISFADKGRSMPIETKVDDLLPGKRYVALDVETTGLNPLKDRIVQIAAIDVTACFSQGKKHFNTEAVVGKINPEMPIPYEASIIHGIFDDDVANESIFADYVTILQRTLKDAIIIGHNVEFDINFVNAELIRAGASPLNNKTICTLAYAREILPQLIGYQGSYKLSELMEKIFPNIKRKPHDATADALNAVELLSAMINVSKDYGITIDL
jgi:DNA polymerase III epsilon subunit family exonuclease